MIKARFNRLTRVNNVEPFADEDEWLFSLLLLIVLSPRLLYTRQQNGYQRSLVSKQHRLIKCLANNHKSSCMLAHGYRKGDERLSLPQIEAEWSLLFFLLKAFYKNQSQLIIIIALLICFINLSNRTIWYDHYKLFESPFKLKKKQNLI